jgi:amino acid adenylation domain-containing protein
MNNNTIEAFRLSAQQERVWLEHVDHAGWPPAECEVLLEGFVEPSRLQEALRVLVLRHEILRTIFCRKAGMKVPFQMIQEEAKFFWQTADLRQLDESAQRAEIQQLFGKQRIAQQLEKGPALRAVLAILGPQKHVLLLSLPALCVDFRSLKNLVAEIGRGYTFDPQNNTVTSEVIQYVDVVQWQEELLTSDDTKAGREFWRDYFRKLDFSSWNSVISPFESKLEVAFAPAVVVEQLDASLVGKLIDCGLRQSSSIVDILLACCQLLLARITSQPTITIGCEFDGRNYKELEDGIGVFSKYLPLQLHIDPGMAFRLLLDQVKSCVAELHKWQESFAWQQMEGPTGSDHDGQKLTFAFDYQELPVEQTYGGVKFRILRQEVCAERFKVKLSVRRQGDELRLEFYYDASRLERETVERWSRCFQTLLAAAVEKPEMLVSRLPMLNEGERRRLLVEWNQTEVDYPQGCLQELFEAQVERTPDQAAVRCEGQQLSYRELNEQANQLAHYLRRVGVGPDSLVGLCVERGVEMLVGLLGILKAGGAYVPLSADHPQARLAQQLAGAVVLLTEQKLLGQMPEFAGETLCLDRDQSRWLGQPRSNPEVQTQAENLAYVIYTSGSTGVPKGVGVRHRNLVNYAHFMGRRLELGKYAKGLQFATVSALSADLGNTCIYPALISGGCVHVIRHEVAVDSQRLGRYMHAYPVDVLKIVPSHLMALLDSGGGTEVLPRKYLVLGGEVLTRQLVERIDGLGASCEIVNHYGPTETTVGSLTLRLRDYEWKQSSAQSIAIGRPVANTRIYILDAQGEPVPIGVPGELYIAGVGVAAGYVHQPERTAERFLPELWGEDRKGKMYRTGDLVRYLPDGNVEFLGRIDDQVKIRGFRIELGEIVSVLTQHGAVKQAVVLAREDQRGDKRLVAYVVGKREQRVDEDELRSYLKKQLPDYMVPTAIVVLPKLPLTSNGKIDRQALPAPEQSSSERKAYLAPQTPTEQLVAGIWAEVLHRDDIGAQDNFFEIGGHSLLATQVISRIRRSFNIDLPLRTLFESPTIVEFAERIDHARRENLGLLPPPLTRVSRDEALPLSFAQQRLWVLDQLGPNNPLYNILRAVRMKGALNIEALRTALNEIMRRHESQRTSFGVREDGQAVQIIASPSSVSLPLVDLTSSPENVRESAARRIAEEQALEPFDLAKGPLVRALLLRLGADDHLLLLIVHHIASDAWSAGIFLQEMGTLYECFSRGEPSPLSELPIQYADYAAWQRKWFQGDVLKKQLDYWREQLQGAPPVLDLPSDRLRPKTPSFLGAYVSVPLPPELARALKELSQREGVTLFMTLLAGFQVLLSRYSRQEQIVVGTDVANRTSMETEGLMGFFINLLALRTDLSGDPTFRELLGRVREVALGAYAHQDLPFDRLVEELQPERSLTHNPIVQCLFVMQNIPRTRSEFGGLQLRPFEMPVTRSKFDLAVFIAEVQDTLVGHWLFSVDLFERITILRMARHFETLLRSAVVHPDLRLGALEMLTEEEKIQREEDRKRRNESQLKQLRTIEPETISLTSSNRSAE